MTKKIYEYVNEKVWDRQWETKIFLLCNMLFFMFVGGVAWLLLGRLIWPGLDALVCFIGYPGIFVGLIGGILFLYRQTQ